LEKIQEVVADIWSSRDGSAGALQTDVTVEEQVIAAFDLAMSPGTGRAAAKAGLRTVSQSMAREYGPKGIHVAHVVIDGGILGDRLRNAAPAMVEALGSDGLLGYEAIAENYWMLHRQPRSAWTQELDIRPYKENW
jgi:NAD(P)-dependent dehydrogenase (short-subunit alcohol dehydrogenase family)